MSKMVILYGNRKIVTSQEEVQRECERSARNASRVYCAMKEAERRLAKLQAVHTFWAERKLELQRYIVPIKVVPRGQSGLKPKTSKTVDPVTQAKAMSSADRQKLIAELQAME